MVRTLALLALLATPIGAQVRGMYGGISTGQMVGTINDPGFGSRLGATVSGLPQTGPRINMGPGIYAPPHGGHRGGGGGGRGGRTIVVPYGIPMGYGYGGYPNDYGPDQSMNQPVQAAPPVIINQYYSPDVVRPQMREYYDLPAPMPQTEMQPGDGRVYPPSARQQSRPIMEAPPEDDRAAEARAEAANKQNITLLAFTDSTVTASIAYWQQGDRLHYVTTSYAVKNVPIGMLDKALSEQLNKERKVEFRLESMRQ